MPLPSQKPQHPTTTFCFDFPLRTGIQFVKSTLSAALFGYGCGGFAEAFAVTEAEEVGCEEEAGGEA